MIVTRVRLHPFGCFADRLLELSPGLNVVLGPNEAGKSTVFKAVRHALFVPTRLTKPDQVRLLVPYLPIGGGDAIQVELVLSVGGAHWTLRRRWGASAGSELVSPAGVSLTDEAALKEELVRLLPATPAVVSSILMTGQSELAATVASLRAHRQDPLADLADTLRRTVQETGGISVDRFTARVARELAKSFGHWDDIHNGPQKDGNGRDRGIEQPWKQDVGAILQAWYAAESARVLWRKAVACEGELDVVNQRLRATAERLAACSAFLAAHEAAARDARERRALEAERGRIGAEADALRAASSEWQLALARSAEMRGVLAGMQTTIIRGEKELQAARRSEEGRSLREKYAKILRRIAQVEEACAMLAAVPPLERKALDEIRRASSEVDKLLAGNEAGKITVTVTARAEVDLLIREDGRAESRRFLGPGQTADLQAAGRVRIVHKDMEMDVSTGDADAAVRREKLAGAQRLLTALLEKNGAADAADAEARSREYERRLADVDSAEKNLGEELAGDTVDELKGRVAALGAEEPHRPSVEIAAALATDAARADALTRDLESLRERVLAWEKSYGSAEKLMDQFAEKRFRHNELAARVESFAPLPASYRDAAEFLQAFDREQKEQTDLRVARERLEGDKRALTARAPDQSSEELASLLQEAEEALQSARRHGAALQRVEAARVEALGAGEAALYDGMRGRLQETIAVMTGGRHARVTLDGAMPAALAGPDGAALPWNMLSAGTQDALALALRLAMASFFIEGSDGFLMMDDPLVDMDPDRQRAAARTLGSFAEGRQLIVFTCHPSTADLLGGRRITLS